MSVGLQMSRRMVFDMGLECRTVVKLLLDTDSMWLGLMVRFVGFLWGHREKHA